MDKGAKQSFDESYHEHDKLLRQVVLTSSEGHLLIIGFTMALIYICWLGTNLLFYTEKSQVLVGMTVTEIIFGRAASMSLGYSQSLDHQTVIPICATIETILVFIFYPLFVFSWRHLLNIKWLKKTFDRTQRAAEARELTIQRYGIIGLFVFVWIPFWMTGPVVGCVIGFLLGLRLWVNMVTVLSGTYVAIFFWAFFLRQIHDKVATYSSYMTIILLSLFVIIIICKLLFRFINKRKGHNF